MITGFGRKTHDRPQKPMGQVRSNSVERWAGGSKLTKMLREVAIGVDVYYFSMDLSKKHHIFIGFEHKKKKH